MVLGKGIMEFLREASRLSAFVASTFQKNLKRT